MIKSHDNAAEFIFFTLLELIDQQLP